jgi:hypothetical protein
MSTQTKTDSRIFQTSRRRSHLLFVGAFLVLGYLGSAAALIHAYTVEPSEFEQIA